MDRQIGVLKYEQKYGAEDAMMLWCYDGCVTYGVFSEDKIINDYKRTNVGVDQVIIRAKNLYI